MHWPHQAALPALLLMQVPPLPLPLLRQLVRLLLHQGCLPLQLQQLLQALHVQHLVLGLKALPKVLLLAGLLASAVMLAPHALLLLLLQRLLPGRRGAQT